MSLFAGTDGLWEIVDALRPIRYVSPGAGRERLIDRALLRPSGYRSTSEPPGVLRFEEVVCHVPAEEGFNPRPGDHLYTSDGRRFTVLSAELVAAGTRWRLLARDLVLAHGLDRHVTVELLTWERKADGTLVRRWKVWKTGLRAAVSLYRAEAGTSPRRSYERRYRVVLEECPPVDHLLRLRTPAGRILQVLSVHAADRVDALPWVEAVEVDLG